MLLSLFLLLSQSSFKLLKPSSSNFNLQVSNFWPLGFRHYEIREPQVICWMLDVGCYMSQLKETYSNLYLEDTTLSLKFERLNNNAL